MIRLIHLVSANLSLCVLKTYLGNKNDNDEIKTIELYIYMYVCILIDIQVKSCCWKYEIKEKESE